MNQFFKGVKGMEFPKVDMNDFFGTYRKNLEAFSAANRIISEGTQTIARRSSEFMRDNVEEALNATRDMMASSSPEKNASKQSEFAKHTVQNGMNQFREVTEMATKSQFEAFDLLSNRLTHTIEEAKTFADKKSSKKAA